MPKLYDYILNKVIKKPEGDMTTGSILYINENGDLTWSKLDTLMFNVLDQIIDIGQIQIISTPGQWKIVGEDVWYNSSTIITKPTGNFVISFSDVDGYNTPDNINIVVEKNQTTIETIQYYEFTGYIQITSTPGQWKVISDPSWNDSNTSIQKAIGDYEITFSNVEFYETPENINVTVLKDETVTHVANYVAIPQPLTPQPWGDTGIFGGGLASTSVIEQVNISSTGNAQLFGNLTAAKRSLAACSNRTNGVFGGGASTSVIEYVTIATASNGILFGYLLDVKIDLAACSNNTRGLFCAGTNASYVSQSRIEYITIATMGNSVNNGQLSVITKELGACGNMTKAVFGGGAGTSSPSSSEGITSMFTKTFSTSANTTSCGSLTISRRLLTGFSSDVRGIFAGGTRSATTNVSQTNIDYITFASLSSAIIFGSLTTAKHYPASCSNMVRGLIAGGSKDTLQTSTIEYVTIANTGNTATFGNLTKTTIYFAGCSGN